MQAFQDTYKDRWLECARRAFAELDAGGSGALGAAEIASAFGSHLSPYEVDAGGQAWGASCQTSRGRDRP